MSLKSTLHKVRLQLSNLVYETLHPGKAIIIDGCLNYNVERSVFVDHNLGDDLNFPLLHELTGCRIIPRNYRLFKSKTDFLLVIGSIIEKNSTERATIWGSGLIDIPQKVSHPKRICAVRGPRTKAELGRLGIPCPDIFGDPAIILPKIYRPDIEKNIDVGFIPHITDQSTDFAIKWRAAGRTLLDLKNYGNWRDFIDRLCRCKTIISSSLHGIILAEAYGIPARRIILSDRIIGGDFKFEDYYLSYRNSVPANLTTDELLDEKVYADSALENAVFPPAAMAEDLLKAFPYRDRLKPEYATKI